MKKTIKTRKAQIQKNIKLHIKQCDRLIELLVKTGQSKQFKSDLKRLIKGLKIDIENSKQLEKLYKK